MTTTGDGVAGTELGPFLRARRGRLAPEDVGLSTGPGVRRTPGLRREELATLAGISIDYYIRLERGKETNPSPSVIDALARTLLLDPAEHEHLRLLAWHSLARPASSTPPRGEVSTNTRLILERLRPFPAYVTSSIGDLLAWNPGGLRLLTGMDRAPFTRRNISRWVFLDPAARSLFPDWDSQLRDAVSHLRSLAGSDPNNRDLAQLVGELLVKSPDFARMWAEYDVGLHIDGPKIFTHPEVGKLRLRYQALHLDSTGGQLMVTYLAAPATPDHDALILLDQLGTEGTFSGRPSDTEDSSAETLPRITPTNDFGERPTGA